METRENCGDPFSREEISARSGLIAVLGMGGMGKTSLGTRLLLLQDSLETLLEGRASGSCRPGCSSTPPGPGVPATARGWASAGAGD